MNEQIIKLAVEAGVINYIDHETPRQYFVHADLDVEDIERFAELIIDQCIDVVIKSDNNPKMIVHEPYRTIMNNIQDNFYGVK